MLKKCPVCGKSYKPIKSNQVVCSDKCRKEYRRNYQKAYHSKHLEEFQDYYMNFYHTEEIDRCSAKHGGCYSCPTKNGDCIYE